MCVELEPTLALQKLSTISTLINYEKYLSLILILSIYKIIKLFFFLFLFYFEFFFFEKEFAIRDIYLNY